VELMPFYKSSGHQKYSKPRQLTFSLEFNPPKERKKEKKKEKRKSERKKRLYRLTWEHF